MRKYLLLLSLFFFNHCFSQGSLRLQHLTVEDGISQSSVNSIFQDSYGFIWLATGDGLNRYDGKEFLSYKSKLRDSLQGRLKDRNINSLVFEDKHQNLWFTADEGVYCMNRRSGKFNLRITKHEAAYAAVMLGVDTDAVWVCVPNKGVYRISLDSTDCMLYPFKDAINNKDKLVYIKNGVNAIGGIWIADVKGLIFFDKQTNTDKRILQLENIYRVFMLHDGRLFLATNNGVLHYNTKTGSKEFISITIPGKETAVWNMMAEDKIQGHVYIAETNGGTICKLNLFTKRYEFLAFQGNGINMLFIDRSQNLWIGTEGGGAYKLDLKPEKFHGYVTRVSNNDGFMVKSIYRDDSGKIWMGVFDKGIIQYDPHTKIEKVLPVVPTHGDIFVNVIMKDSSGNILVAMNDKVLWLDELTGEKKKQIILPLYPHTSGLAPIIYALTEWKKGHYLVGTNHGLYIMRNVNGVMKTGLQYSFFNDSLINGWIYNFYMPGDGSIYIGKRNGFSKIKMLNDSDCQLQESGLYGLPVRHFYKSTTTPLVWIATEQGLVAYNETTKKYKVFDESSGIANSYVYAILPENDSTLWVSTNKGLSKVRVKYRATGEAGASFVNYTSKDGLQSNEFNTGAYFKGKDGTMIFGGIAGINWFDPKEIVSNPYKAIPAITAIYINDTLMATDTIMYLNSISLPYQKNTISFTLRALEYTQPDQNMFAYMLVGLDKEWVYTSSDKVRYSSLAPGSYTFLLKVRNNENLWNETPLKMDITILPPFWQTWWFRVFVLLVLASGTFVVVRWYIRQRINAKTSALEKQHALNLERIRISKDVHDDIGSGLSKISLLSEMANKKVRENLSPGKDIDNISVISKELVDNMRDLIWVLNPENTSLDTLVSRLREYCADYLDGVAIHPVFSFAIEVPEMSISREVQRNIFSTVKEAVNNAVKHSGATEMFFRLSVNDNLLSISIADNGVGFSADELRDGCNGLRNMRQRIESLGGQYEMVSVVGKGTTVSIVVPFDRLGIV